MVISVLLSRTSNDPCRTLDVEICRVWELRVSNLWPIMRLYPNLRILAMEHVRNQVRISLGVGGGGLFLSRKPMYIVC